MDNSSHSDNAPLYKPLIAVFSNRMHHNYMLERREGYPLMPAVSV